MDAAWKRLAAERLSSLPTGWAVITTLATWVEANCPDEAVQKNILKQADGAETDRHDYQVLIGGPLTKSGKAYLVRSYGGNLFVFALTDEQAAICGITGRVTAFCPDWIRPVLSKAPTLVIDGFEVNDADGHSWFEPLCGSCRYHSEAAMPVYPCVRVQMILAQKRPPGQVCRQTLYGYPWIPPGTATIEFELGPVCRNAPSADYVTPQLVAVFLTVCTTPDQAHGREAVPISDALAALVRFT
jgi:hypothetical protein